MKSSWDKSKVRAEHSEVRNMVERVLRTKEKAQAPLSEIARELEMSPTSLSNAIRNATRIKMDRGWCAGNPISVSIKPIFL
jgi:hypothetical protein